MRRLISFVVMMTMIPAYRLDPDICERYISEYPLRWRYYPEERPKQYKELAPKKKPVRDYYRYDRPRHFLR